MEICSCIETCSRGTTRCRICVVVFEHGSEAGDSIDIWSLYDRVPRRRKAVAAPLIEGDEENSLFTHMSTLYLLLGDSMARVAIFTLRFMRLNL